MSKGTLLFHLVAFRRRGQDQTARAWTVSKLQKGHVEQGGLLRNGEECVPILTLIFVRLYKKARFLSAIPPKSS